ncbi:C39 family peptidase [Lentibacillus sp. L22]|uniref:C39 family peptidase n=1 Tax=Lentibacillus TaxID=175304 RepID=UPI0022B1DD2C|nr:C39 family peptidase [Lentibacillus daqui]
MENKHKCKIDGVPTINQHPELPTGCEATSLAMLLTWAGKTVSKFAVVEKLSKGEKVRFVDGTWYGANPNDQFVGDPYTDDGSFGVFEKPILETIDHFLPGKGVDLTGQDFEVLLNVVRSGTPVMAWTTINQNETYHSKSWQDPAGNTIDWYCNEHAVVIIGIDGDHVIVNDPYTGKEEHYDRHIFEHNWASMKKRAVTVDVDKSE